MSWGELRWDAVGSDEQRLKGQFDSGFRKLSDKANKISILGTPRVGIEVQA